MKEEPQWMLDFRLKSLEQFYKMPMPQWGGDMDDLNFDEITVLCKTIREQGRHGKKFLKKLKQTFDKLGIPEAEQKYLSWCICTI